MKTVLATISLLGLFATGCKGGGDDLAKQYEEWANSVCACKDVECANKANEEGMKKMQEAAAKIKDADQAKELATKAQDAGKKAMECIAKLSAAK